jgi:hypothetical protein
VTNVLQRCLSLGCVAAAGIAACFLQANGQEKTGNPGAAAHLPIPAGIGQQTADLGGVSLQVFTYRPTGCAISGAFLVFHGMERNAEAYRDDAVPLAERICVLVVAPLFDKTRFPTWRYQRGGIVNENGSIQPPESWTVNLVPRLMSWVRDKQSRADLRCSLIGHSAGAQFLSRVVAFAGDEAVKTIIANPSTWVRPSLDIAAPYGFKGVSGRAWGEAALRGYLAARITVLLGQEDVGSRNLAMGEEAEEQGTTRLERGQNVFREAETTARRNGWAFNWQLVVVPGVGHNARSIFGSDQAFDALRP